MMKITLLFVACLILACVSMGEGQGWVGLNQYNDTQCQALTASVLFQVGNCAYNGMTYSIWSLDQISGDVKETLCDDELCSQNCTSYDVPETCTAMEPSSYSISYFESFPVKLVSSLNPVLIDVSFKDNTTCSPDKGINSVTLLGMTCIDYCDTSSAVGSAGLYCDLPPFISNSTY